MTAYRPVWLQQSCNSCGSLAGLVLCFIASFILLVIAPLQLAYGRTAEQVPTGTSRGTNSVFYCSPDINLADIIDTAHDNLFHQVLNDPNHVLAHLLPNRTSSQYNFRTRQHDRQLIPKMSKIYDNNFIVRMLYKDVY